MKFSLRRKPGSELSKKHKTLLVSIVISAALTLIGILSMDSTMLANMLFPAITILILPYFLQRYAFYRWVKSLEGQFPNFVRDLADAKRSGMSFPQSIEIASRSNYGKLTPEVKRMHNKLSWGIPFVRVINLFKERTGGSKLITEAMTVIEESFKSGGDVASTLDSIARDIVMLKETEAERVSMLKQNVMIMYGIFFMFVGISIMIIFVMVPMVQTQPNIPEGSFGFSFDNPCQGVSYFPCNVFGAIGFFLGASDGIASYYIAIFFVVVLTQGIFIGLIAGQLGENSVTAGSKHAIIMTLSGVGLFIFLAKAGFFPA